MKKIQSLLLPLVGILFCGVFSLQASRLIMGSIQFPNSITTVPMIRVYCCGQIIYQSCETEHESKKFIFKIPKSRYQKKFHLLVTESINFKVEKSRTNATQNTVKYLTVPGKQAYKLYKLKLMQTESEKQIDAENKEPNDYWVIEEKSIPEKTRKIPNDAIIICFNPDWVERLRSESAYELPTIELKKNLLELAGSENKLTEFANLLLLTSINSDTIHATMHQVVKQDHQRTTIAPPSA